MVCNIACSVACSIASAIEARSSPGGFRAGRNERAWDSKQQHVVRSE
jgi:hypothetical protein